MDLGLRDRVVLVTGGGGGAGPTIGRAFAAEGALVALAVVAVWLAARTFSRAAS